MRMSEPIMRFEVLTMNDDLCDICGEPFSPEEWDDRHSADNGEDIHETCCYAEGQCSR